MPLPKTIGQYEILERLSGASQGMELFRARRHGGGAPVCLKRVHPNYEDSPRFAERFEQEIALAQRLRHRNIVEVSEFGEDDGHFFVMEYVDGPNLDALLRAGPLGPPLVAYLGVELCRALAYLHHSDPRGGRGPVIHADLAPHNVLLSRQDGGVKLSDFGLAKALGRTGQEVLTEARGKPMHMAPEQLADEKISARTDLFGLGLILWCALVGVHPYVEERPRGVALNEWIRQRTLTNTRRPLGQAAPHAPADLVDAVEGLLQPVQRRIPTAEDVFHLLRGVEPLDGHAQLVAWVAQATEDSR